MLHVSCLSFVVACPIDFRLQFNILYQDMVLRVTCVHVGDTSISELFPPPGPAAIISSLCLNHPVDELIFCADLFRNSICFLVV
jgi:hypothetical protein